MLKKISLYLLSFFLLAPSCIFSVSMPQGGMFPYPTEQELREIEEFLSQLSPEELQELEKMGQQIIEEAEKNGVDLFAPPANMPAPQLPKKEETGQPKQTKNEKRKELKTSKNELSAIRNILTSLIEVVHSIRQKAATEPEFELSITPFNEPLNFLLYYLYLINDDAVAGYLKEKEFTGLYHHLTRISDELEGHNRNFDVPDSLMIEATTKKARRHQKEQIKAAHHVLENILHCFRTAFSVDKINDQLKALLEKHEPELLKIKQGLEQKGKNAYDYIKKIPVTNTTRPILANYTPGKATNRAVGALAKNAGVKGYKGSGQQQNGKNASSNTEKTGSDTNNKKNPQKKKDDAQQTALDLEKEIINNFADIEGTLSSYHAEMMAFLEGQSKKPKSYKYDDKDVPEKVLSTFKNAIFSLTKIESAAKKWHGILIQESKNVASFNAGTKKMRQEFNATKNPKLNSLYQRTATLESYQLGNGAPKKFNDLMASIEKKLTDV